MADKLKKYLSILQQSNYTPEFKDLVAEQILQLCVPVQPGSYFICMLEVLLGDFKEGEFKKQHLCIFRGILKYIRSSPQIHLSLLQMIASQSQYSLSPSSESQTIAGFIRVCANLDLAKIKLIDIMDAANMNLLNISECCLPLLSHKDLATMEEQKQDKTAPTGSSKKGAKGKKKSSGKKKKTVIAVLPEAFAKNLEGYSEALIEEKKGECINDNLGWGLKKKKEAPIENEGKENGATTEASCLNRILLMDIVLSIFLQLKQKLLNECWVNRQVSALLIKEIFNEFKMEEISKWELCEYSSETVRHINSLQYSDSSILNLRQDIISRLFIGILSDHFTDYLENNIATPVREAYGHALVAVLRTKFNVAITQVLFENIVDGAEKIIDNKDTFWIVRYNAILIVKFLLESIEKSSIATGMTTDLGYAYLPLLKSLFLTAMNANDDEIFILASQLLRVNAKFFAQESEYYIKLIKAIFSNLTSADDIDSSAVHLLQLLQELIQENLADLPKAINEIDFNVINTFMFHKLASIRGETYELIFKIVGVIFKEVSKDKLKDKKNTLVDILQYALQAVAMEQEKKIIKTILQGSKKIISLTKKTKITKWVKKSIPLIQYLLIEGKITAFSSFVFPDYSRTTYYDIIPEPITPQEIDGYYFSRMHNVMKFLSYLMKVSDEISGMFTDMYSYLPKCSPENSPKAFYLSKSSQKAALLRYYYLSSSPTLSAETFAIIKLYPNLILSIQEPIAIISDFIQEEAFEILTRGIPDFLRPLPEISLMTEDMKMNLSNNLEKYFTAIQNYYMRMKNVSSPSAGSTAGILLGISKLRDKTQAELAKLKVYAAATLVFCSSLEHKFPEKLNPIIRPLLCAIQNETDEYVGKIAAKALAKLQEIANINCSEGNNGNSINEKIVNSVISMHSKGWSISSFAASQILPPQSPSIHLMNILTQQIAPAVVKSTYVEYIKKYIKCYKENAFTVNNNALLKNIQYNLQKFIEGKENEVIQKEAVASEIVLISECLQYINPEKYQDFYEHILKTILTLGGLIIDTSNPIMKSLLHSSVQPHLIKSLIKSMKTIKAKNTIYSYITIAFMKIIHSKAQLGLTIFSGLLTELPKDYLDYTPYFVFPIISNFSNSSKDVSNQSYQLFSNLLKILPINSISFFNKKIPALESGDSSSYEKEGTEGIKFLQSFLQSGEQKYDYSIQVPLKERLRNYQIDGVSWMAFMHKYNINCALCDDMGIGKTVQALTLIANEMQRLKRTNAYSLIICPSTLTKNWLYEIPKFFDDSTLKGVIYSGSKSSRKSKKQVELKYLLKNYNIIITSYDKIRVDLDKFLCWNFFYLVLDEAHIVKNAKAKITHAVKQLNAERKLILSGTPLHNNVTEIWSLFDFLNPGFLGSEQQFDTLYTKHLITNLKKINEKIEETKDFGRALESLKQRIAPFILRRTKNDVLKDLPQKIIQDSNCKLSHVQKIIFKELNERYPLDCKGGERMKKDSGEKSELMLQRIQWHLLACNHPGLIMEKNILDKKVIKEIEQYLSVPPENYRSLAIEHSGKLLSLKEILHQCGIGKIETVNLGASEIIEENPISQLIDPVQHRALIFCQKASMLDIIENSFLKIQYPDIKYLRLDSRVEALKRVDLARQFNDDPSIKLMLLTTKVGGYGLTLTGADTVIFYDHDWNPMNDLQAMDRTHRIGQKHTVNVYRLIMDDTIEEKVLCYQRFKENLAKSLIENEKTTSDKLNIRDMFESFAGKADEEEELKKAKKKAGGENYMEDLAKKWAQEDAERGDLE